MPEESPQRIDFPCGVLCLLVAGYAVHSLLVSIPLASLWFDEGFYAAAAWRILAGDRLYETVSFPYGPLLPTLYAAIFYLLSDVQFYFVRVAGMLMIALSGVLAYGAARQITKNGWISLLSPLALYGCLGGFQGCRLSASSLAGLWSLLAIMAHLWDIRSPRRYKIVCLGIVLGLSVLTKHNVALLDLGIHSLLIAWRTVGQSAGQSASFWVRLVAPRIVLISLALVTTAVLGCWVCETSLWDFLRSGFFANMNARYAKLAGIPFPWPWVLLKTQHVSFWGMLLSYYYSTWLLLVGAVLLEGTSLFRYLGKAPGAFLVFTAGYAQYLQMFPLSDNSHYVRATMVLSIVFACVAQRAWGCWCSGRSVRAALYGVLVLVSFSLHTKDFVINEVRLARTVLVTGYPPPSALLHCRHLRRFQREPLIVEITQALRAEPHDRMFVAGVESVFYLLANKRPVVRGYDTTPLTIHSADQEHKIIQILKDQDIGLILKCPPFNGRPEINTERLPILWAFISENFSTVTAVRGYEIMTKTASTPSSRTSRTQH